MRGWDARSDVLFSYVNCEERVPKDHPLRVILRIVDAALAALSPRFEGLYAKFGRPSIPPERLLRALLLQAFYSVRSERQLIEQLEYNLLFRWFVGLWLDDEIWDVTVFTKNRERLINNPQDRAQRMIVWNPSLAVHITEQHVAPCIPTAHRTSPNISPRNADHTPISSPIERLFRSLLSCSLSRFGTQNICFRGSGTGRLRGAHSRRQDPKTPVEQALIRGLVTA